MRKIICVLIILIFTKQSYALDCLACEATDTEETCDLSYKCPKGTKYCETLVSKVEGSYSVIMSCATDEKCKADPILEDGLAECSHDEDNTECYSCCKGDDCNTLESALKELPDDIFESEKPAKKGKKNKEKKSDDDEEEIEEKDEETDDEEDTNVKDKKDEKKKSKGKDRKSKSKEEEPEKEESDEENSEEPDEETSDDQIDKSVATANETSVEATNENPENGTVIDKTIPNVDNQTVVVTNLTANATEEGAGNNNNTEQVIEPLDPNIQEIDKTLNETVDVVEDLLDSFGNAENADNIENTGFEPNDVADNSTNIELEETQLEDGTLYNSPGDNLESALNEINNNHDIMSESQNADTIGEQHGLQDEPSSSTKYQISEILLLATSIIILIQFF